MHAIQLTAALFLLSILSSTLHAECECLWEGSFTEVQSNADLVLSATVLSGKGNSIDLTVNRVLRGQEPGDSIRIWLKAEDYCRPDAKIFPAGSQWVMALSKIKEVIPGGFNPLTPNISYGRIDDYSLSNCGGYWLHQSGEVVTGNLINAPRWERDPKMTPVLLDLIAAFVQGKLDTSTVAEASREDPALRSLMLDTKAFVRQEK
jgi:hypothetical protein